MNREKRELMGYKFEKLSDANKIRFQLGNIILLQGGTQVIVMLFGSLIFGYISVLPFVIKFGSVGKFFILGSGGLLMATLAVILFWVLTFRMNKSEKALEDFLNKKSKK